MQKPILILALFTLITADELPAVTAEDLAGVYVGKRTETHPSFADRYDEVLVFEADGRVTDYLYLDGFSEPLIFSGHLEISEDGGFPAAEYGEGLLIPRGRHLTVSIKHTFPPTPAYPDGYPIHIVFRGHRTEKPLDLPPPAP